eukprot:2001370-Prymnesium_polylepis.1
MLPGHTRKRAPSAAQEGPERCASAAQVQRQLFRVIRAGGPRALRRRAPSAAPPPSLLRGCCVSGSGSRRVVPGRARARKRPPSGPRAAPERCGTAHLLLGALGRLLLEALLPIDRPLLVVPPRLDRAQLVLRDRDRALLVLVLLTA